MVSGAIETAILALHVAERELMLFCAFWFLLGAVDDIGIDVCWLWLRFTGRAGSTPVSRQEAAMPLQGRAAILIAAWNEAGVIGHTVRHALSVWRQDDFTLYIGCYRGDAATVAAAMAGAGADCRTRIVIHDRDGPSTKADCLNRLYVALGEDEHDSGRRYRSVIIHDAEDMVHPAELAVIDMALGAADFVQLPVRPEPQPASPWVAGHYTDEFTEAHAKTMVVRDALGAAIPAAGVGCGFRREMLATIAGHRQAAGGSGPFAAECLTEDYELGIMVRRLGGRARFLRRRDADGALVATRAYFPATLQRAVRQKARWIHGIALQGWDRLGWGWGRGEFGVSDQPGQARDRRGRGRRLTDLWMAVRDRRGPFVSIVLACGYALVVVEGLLAMAGFMGLRAPSALPPTLHFLLMLCLAGLVWRSAFRFAFTASEYGPREGLLAVPRMLVGNFVAIIAGRQAIVAYARVLRGHQISWAKTAHDIHPAAEQGKTGW